jgi:hypothetical protein
MTELYTFTSRQLEDLKTDSYCKGYLDGLEAMKGTAAMNLTIAQQNTLEFARLGREFTIVYQQRAWTMYLFAVLVISLFVGSFWRQNLLPVDATWGLFLATFATATFHYKRSRRKTDEWYAARRAEVKSGTSGQVSETDPAEQPT